MIEGWKTEAGDIFPTLHDLTLFQVVFIFDVDSTRNSCDEVKYFVDIPN